MDKNSPGLKLATDGEERSNSPASKKVPKSENKYPGNNKFIEL